MKTSRTVLAMALSLAALAGLAGRAPGEPQTIDKIAAVVNNEVILKSELDEQLATLAASRQLDTSDSSQVAEARRQILDQMIEEHLIVDYATEKKIEVTDEMIKPQVDQALEEARSRVGSPAEFEKELARQGLTLDELRTRYTQEIRKQAMAQRIVDREIRSKVKITDADVDTFYRNNQAKLPLKPTAYQLAHILIVPKPEAARRAAARDRAQRALQRLEAGETWESVCKAMSEDPTTAAGGGDLGVANEGDFDPQFEAAVRQLEPGQRSGVVESSFGFHIIELIARDGASFHARHILILAQPTPDDVAKSIERAKMVHDRAVKGEDWMVLVNSYTDDASSKSTGGSLGEVPASSLGREYVDALDSLKVGGISEVLQGPTGYHIFKLIGKTEGGAYNYEEVKEQLHNLLMQRKLGEEYDRWMAELKKKAYIEIKP